MKFLSKNWNKIIIIGLLAGLFAFRILDVGKYLQFSPDGQVIAAKFQDFITLVISIVVEAFPFVILGVVISVLVGLGFFEWLFKFINAHKLLFFPIYPFLFLGGKIDKALHKNVIYNHVKISLLGIFLPVCECGNVPLARRLILSNLSVSETITFLLAAPVLNPVTFLTTLEAFNYDKSVAIIRMIGGFVIANFVGIIFSFAKNQNGLLTEKFYQEVCEHKEHEHDHHKHSKVKEGLDIFQEEFLEVMKALCIGAILAALSQSFIPRDVIVAIGQNPFLSIIAMILLAFVVSICSNVDAFFALSYAGSFTIGSIISFLVFGPMIDIKILTMMRTTFKPKALIVMTILVTLMSILLGLIVNLIK